MKYIINDLYILDYILLVITFLFIFFSIWKGFIQSILGLMTWIGSIFITLFFYEKLSDYISSKLNLYEFFENTGLSEIIGIIVSIPVIFIISLIILRKIRKLITTDLDKATLGIILDKLFWTIYGIFFSYFIFSVTLFFLNKINENLSFYFIENSQIFLQIYIFNENYIFKHIYFLIENKTIEKIK